MPGVNVRPPPPLSRDSKATSEGEFTRVGTWEVEKTGSPLVRPTSESAGNTRYISTRTVPMLPSDDPVGMRPWNVALVSLREPPLTTKSSADSISILPALSGRDAVAILPSTSPVLKKKGTALLIDADVADGATAFYRFTLAEEFGHVVLHREVVGRMRTLEDVVALHRSPAYYDKLDRNAKRFAAAVLMPPASLREDARAVCTSLRSAGHNLTSLNGKLTIRLSQRYGVSTTSMRYRLTEWPVSVGDAIREMFERDLPTLPA